MLVGEASRKLNSLSLSLSLFPIPSASADEGDEEDDKDSTRSDPMRNPVQWRQQRDDDAESSCEWRHQPATLLPFPERNANKNKQFIHANLSIFGVGIETECEEGSFSTLLFASCPPFSTLLLRLLLDLLSTGEGLLVAVRERRSRRMIFPPPWLGYHLTIERAANPSQLAQRAHGSAVDTAHKPTNCKAIISTTISIFHEGHVDRGQDRQRKMGPNPWVGGADEILWFRNFHVNRIVPVSSNRGSSIRLCEQRSVFCSEICSAPHEHYSSFLLSLGILDRLWLGMQNACRLRSGHGSNQHMISCAPVNRSRPEQKRFFTRVSPTQLALATEDRWRPLTTFIINLSEVKGVIAQSSVDHTSARCIHNRLLVLLKDNSIGESFFNLKQKSICSFHMHINIKMCL